MSARGMRLRKLFAGLPVEWRGPAGDPLVRGVTHDSRRVRKGDLFVALKGARRDGHDFAADVVRRGAAAVAAERPLEAGAPVAVVPSTLAALSPLADRLHGRPSRAMAVVGVTGTNGKTTITYLLESVWRAAGKRPGVIGTVEYRWGRKREDAANTTPFADEIQRLLARMRDDGVTHVAMEVSSHALSLHRVDDVAFQAAVFTNLTRDHLDFHGTMESYFVAKARLFEGLHRSPPARRGPRGKIAIINADDPWSERLRARTRARVVTYGVKNPADLRAEDVALSAAATSFTLLWRGRRIPFRVPLAGLHNVYNSLAAAATALSLGVAPAAVRKGFAALRGVPGRLERVEVPSPKARAAAPSVFVDYAHTDDALKNVLSALRPLTRGRLITVFGCGGDRDRTKRPLMGETAVTMSDHAVVTSDNPRTEDPATITLDIEAGIRRVEARNYEIVLDRAAAIEAALRRAGPGDVVLIAGKGHETYQIFKDRTVHFDDRETARRLMRAVYG